MELSAPMDFPVDLEIFDDVKLDVWQHDENPQDFRSLAFGKKIQTLDDFERENGRESEGEGERMRGLERGWVGE